MTESKPYPLWPEANDKVVVKEMLRDPQSGKWYECREFVRKRIQVQAKNISQDYWDDLIQDTMIRIEKSLPTFQYHCALTTWIVGIIRSCIIDAYRKFKRAGKVIVSNSVAHDDGEREGDTFVSHISRTIEDECILRIELAEAIAALQEYISKHPNPERNERILNMVLFESSSLEQAAQAVGCSAPVASYIVRSAQRYVRERLKGR